jgi:hypothetical protein
MRQNPERTLCRIGRKTSSLALLNRTIRVRTVKEHGLLWHQVLNTSPPPARPTLPTATALHGHYHCSSGGRLASHDCPDVCGSPAAELVPLCRPSGLGQGRRGPQPVYTAPSEDAATERFLEFKKAWGRKYPAIVKLWSDAWAEFVPFLSFDVEIRKVICSTNAIESVNARIRRPVRARGHFPDEAAALKCIYMALMSLDPTGKGRKRWTMRWQAPLNAFQIAFEGRLTPSNN